MPELTLRAAADHAGVQPATLRRWAEQGLIPPFRGKWTPAAAAHARLVSRMRERGHTVAEIREAARDGRLAFAFVEELFPAGGTEVTLDEAVEDTGLERALIERIYGAIGYGPAALERITHEDLALLRYIAAVLASGFPLVAFLQLVRVYGQALAQIADAEIRLFHLYVHEPLIQEGVAGVQMAEEMAELAGELLPLASPIMDHVHLRFLRFFTEQDVVGHMEADLDGEAIELGRVRVAVAFADLAGYTRLTEEAGEETALDAVERFQTAVEDTLPEDARVIKTIGDEVMVVGTDPSALVDWAVGFQALMTERPLPRIGVHSGRALYRDGDYYGRDVNLASRVVARAAGGEVLVTRPVVEAAGPHLEFEAIGEVRLKGFKSPTELFLAHQADE